jgi:acyl-CoA thioester hydrolase
MPGLRWRVVGITGAPLEWAAVNDEFRHRTSLDVRFRDIDAFRHVNNAVFSTFAEQARIQYLLDVIGMPGGFERMPLILARLEIDYRSPIQLGERIAVESRVDRIGRSSIGMVHRILADERLAADVQSVLVTYDYEAARSIPVPDDWRGRVAAHEGRAFPAGTDASQPHPAGSPA